MIPIALDHVPGLAEAIDMVQRVGGVLITPAQCEILAVAAWYEAEPAARAAAFADAADLLHEVAGDTGDSAMQLGLRLGALVLDQASQEMRARG